MSDKIKYIYGKQFAQKLQGSPNIPLLPQLGNYYFRTITGYKVDSNGKPIEGTARTYLYYAPNPGARTSDGKTWTPGTTDSLDNFNPGGWVYAGVTGDNGKTYNFKNYTQEDADLGRIPSGKKVGDPVLGALAQQSLTTSGGRFYEAVQNNLINLAVNTQPGLAQVVSAKQANVAASTAQSKTDGTDSKDTKLKVDTFDVSITPEGIKENYGSYAYPTDLGTNGQDFIQFSIKRYKPRDINLTRSIGIIEERQQLDTVGTIALPIQPSISDSNNVDWNGLTINPLEMELASGSLNIMSQQGQKYVNGLIDRLESMGADPNTLKAAKLYFAQKAAGVNGLLSRFGGGIVNPNLELLFQGPTLRPFTFTFRLSPRDNTEATQVRSIIRVFKEAMAVKTASQQFFLAAPDVFDIRYCQRGDSTRVHPSLNKIKTCALKSCNVDYTPDGSYMTFKDQNNTMVSYNLTLQFQELEPVTSKDYDNNLDQIGY